MKKEKVKKMESISALVVLVVMVVILAICMYRVGGFSMLKTGVVASGQMFLGFIPLMLAICLVGGFGITLSLHYKVWLGEALDGKYGVLATALAGMSFPSFSGFPLAREMWDAGFSHGNLMVFFGTSALFNILTVLFRAPMMGGGIAAVVYMYIALVAVASIPVFRMIGNWL